MHPQQESGLGREGLTNCDTKPHLKLRGSLRDLYFLTVMKSEEGAAKVETHSCLCALGQGHTWLKTSPPSQVHATKHKILGPESFNHCHSSWPVSTEKGCLPSVCSAVILSASQRCPAGTPLGCPAVSFPTPPLRDTRGTAPPGPGRRPPLLSPQPLFHPSPATGSAYLGVCSLIPDKQDEE